MLDEEIFDTVLSSFDAKAWILIGEKQIHVGSDPEFERAAIYQYNAAKSVPSTTSEAKQEAL